MDYALVDSNGNVVNLVSWDGSPSWTPPDGARAVVNDGSAIIGGTYDGTKFISPAESPRPEPTTEELRQSILDQISEIESKSMLPRPVRDLLLASPTTNDKAKADIQSIEDQIVELRSHISWN